MAYHAMPAKYVERAHASQADAKPAHLTAPVRRFRVAAPFSSASRIHGTSGGYRSRCSVQMHAGDSRTSHIERRHLLAAAGAAAALGLVPTMPSRADVTADLVAYTDGMDAFSVSIPAAWASGEGQLDGNSSYMGPSGSRRTLAWFPTDGSARDVNITLVVSNTSMEFTKLGSFGSAMGFGTNLVNSMDRSYLLRSRSPPSEPVQIARLEDALERSGCYYIDYTIQKLPEPRKHLYSLVALGFNGTYNRLYTLTAQCPDSEADQLKPLFDAVFKSFRPPPGKM